MIPKNANPMKPLFFLFLLMIVNISCLSQKAAFFDETTERLSETYYVSFKNNVHVFLKVEQDVVFADFVFWEKFPRRLVSDTLCYDENKQNYVGKSSIIRSRKGKPHVCVKKDNVVFFNDVSYCLENNETEYKEHIKEKNYAVWHEFWTEYREKNVPEGVRLFNVIRDERKISKKLETFSFEEFLEEVEICRKELLPSTQP